MATAKRVNEQDVEALLDGADVEEHVFWGKVLIISYALKNTKRLFTVEGRAACVHPETFDLEIGRKIAREDAKNKIWTLLGYQLAVKLAEESDCGCENGCSL